MVHARHYVSVESKYAVVLVGNASRRFDSPARKLYQRLAEHLKQDGVTALQVALTEPEDEERSVHEVRTGVKYLCGLGSKTVILIGFDRGTPAVLSSVAHETCVAGVALLAYPVGGDIPDISPTSLLVIHAESARTPNASAAQVHTVKGQRVFDDSADDVYRLLVEWIGRVRQERDSQAA